MVTTTTSEASGMVVVTVTMLEASGAMTATVLEASGAVTVAVLEASGTVTVTVLEDSGRVEGETELLGETNPGVSDNDVGGESPEEAVDKLGENRELSVLHDVEERILTCASPILSSASLKK